MSHGIPLVGTFRNGWGINEVETGGHVKDQLHQGERSWRAFTLIHLLGKCQHKHSNFFHRPGNKGK